MMTYYQMITSHNLDSIIQSLSKISSIKNIFTECKNNNIITLEIPQSIIEFENLTKNLDFDYLLIPNYQFIKYLSLTDIKILNVTTNADEDTQVELNELIVKNNNEMSVQFIKKKKILIKSIEVIINNKRVNIYDSGIISMSNNLETPIFKSILTKICEIFA